MLSFLEFGYCVIFRNLVNMVDKRIIGIRKVIRIVLLDIFRGVFLLIIVEGIVIERG